MNRDFFEHSRKRIYSTIKYSLENVAYYRNLWQFELPDYEDFTYDFFVENIPVLTKDDIYKNNNDLIADGYDIKDLLKEGTSGTSGTPISCYKSPVDRFHLSSILWRERSKATKGLNVKDKFAHFYAFKYVDGELTSGRVIEEDNILHLPLINLNEEQLIKNWEAMEQFQPRWIQGGSTALFYMAEVKKKYGIRAVESLELVELNGEYTSDETLDFIKEQFECAVTNHYGCRELWAMAFSCPNGHMHIVDRAVYMEFIFNEETGLNELVVTGLVNKAWPLVRYKVGDSVEIEKVTCDSAFGSGYAVKLGSGRVSSYFTVKGNKRLNAIMFAVILKKIPNRENPGMPSIRQYQAVKMSDTSLVVKLKVDDSIKDKQYIVDKAEYELRKIVDADIEIKYEFVDMFSIDKTGKHREFVDLSK
ncbi:MAG: hypothetical protein PHC69_06295 [Ruminiclostridium sp.]|nr:hypothetical protein [Ruminiclostridium sp.]